MAGFFLSQRRAFFFQMIGATPLLGLLGFQLNQRQTRQDFWVDATERRTFLSPVRTGNNQHSAGY